MKTILFSQDIDSFISLSDIQAAQYFTLDGDTFIVDYSGNILKLNGGYTSNTLVPYIITFVNGDYQQTKTFDNIELYFSSNNQSLVDMAWFSGSRNTTVSSISTDFDLREETHKLSIPRISTEKFASRLRDKFMACNYYIKKDVANNYYFSLPYIKTKYRYSSI